MDDESEIDRRTAVFLRAASKLPSSSNVHLAADLAVTGKHFNPIQRLQKKNPTCTKCCLTLEVSLRIKKRKRFVDDRFV
jgi:hypothetical protein